MRVRELIEELSRRDPDARVAIPAMTSVGTGVEEVEILVASTEQQGAGFMSVVLLVPEDTLSL